MRAQVWAYPCVCGGVFVCVGVSCLLQCAQPCVCLRLFPGRAHHLRQSQTAPVDAISFQDPNSRPRSGIRIRVPKSGFILRLPVSSSRFGMPGLIPSSVGFRSETPEQHHFSSRLFPAAPAPLLRQQKLAPSGSAAAWAEGPVFPRTAPVCAGRIPCLWEGPRRRCDTEGATCL